MSLPIPVSVVKAQLLILYVLVRLVMSVPEIWRSHLRLVLYVVFSVAKQIEPAAFQPLQSPGPLGPLCNWQSDEQFGEKEAGEQPPPP